MFTAKCGRKLSGHKRKKKERSEVKTSKCGRKLLRGGTQGRRKERQEVHTRNFLRKRKGTKSERRRRSGKKKKKKKKKSGKR